MAIPTDRGYVVLRKNDDGTTTVMIATAIENGEPVNVFASHVRAAKVRVDPSVHLVGTGTQSHSNKVVEVFPGDDGVLQVRAPSRRASLTIT
jgi:hypothetical protein